MKKPVLILAFILISLAGVLFTEVRIPQRQNSPLDALKIKYAEKHIASVDHSKLEILQKNFNSLEEVTEACISCHTERHTEVMQSSHFTWDREEYIEGRGIVKLGKKNLINNFCIGIGSNEQTCTKCHAGAGWKDASFEFDDPHKIDCLICHEQTLDYVKPSGKAGYPAESVDLGASARSVGLPTKNNCGTCHFFSGGGNNVKHGDLEVALLESKQDVDVHMGIDGVNLDCIACHQTEKHNITGQLYSVSSMNKDRVECAQCHTQTPHEDNILNEHTLKVACQTCHIPEYAKVNATKMTWDWSTAGKLKDGKPYHEEDEDGNHTYLSIKGSFDWQKNVQPEYTWFNGTADHYLLGDKVNVGEVTKINTLNGDYSDPESKIIPVKIHRARQIYDCEHKTIIQPKLFAEKQGEGGFWKDFDWGIAAKLGMEAVDEEFSGSYCFIETEMSWPINHMVSPKEEALSCNECHTRQNSRLANLTDFYMPGRDYNKFVEFAGFSIIVLSFAGVLLHMFIRIFFNLKRKNGAQK